MMLTRGIYFDGHKVTWELLMMIIALWISHKFLSKFERLIDPLVSYKFHALKLRGPISSCLKITLHHICYVARIFLAQELPNFYYHE